MAGINLTPTRITNLRYDDSGAAIQRLWDSQVPGLGIEVYKSQRKSFIFRYRIHNKQRIIKIGDVVDYDIDQIRDIALANRKKVIEGIDPKLEKGKQAANTVQALFNDYIETPYFKERSPDFQSTFKASLNKHLIRPYGHQALDTFKRVQVRTMVNDLIAQSKNGAARNVLANMRILFAFGLENELMENSPAEHFKPKFTTDGKRKVPFNAHTDESKELVKAAWNINASIQARGLVRWAILTGCRRDEARCTTWSQFANGEWTVEHTKNDNPLVLPMMPMMEAVYDEMRRTFSFSEYMFPSTIDNGKALPRGSLDYQIRNMPWTMHHLRHWCETGLADLNIIEEHRDLILNHVRRSTGSRYNHSTGIKAKTEALTVWHEWIAGVVS
ncbi:MAG TPA: integrase family protein [Gammaproteobacteria bacterium]|nr:integrase family protein [Gammaproteobacteria bacterium]